jgi:hypothetical protein
MCFEMSLQCIAGSTGMTLMRSPFVFDCLELCLLRFFLVDTSLLASGRLLVPFCITFPLTRLAQFKLRDESFLSTVVNVAPVDP